MIGPVMKKTRAAQSGFSLVELMIASALGMVIVAWLTQLLVDTAKLNREMANTNDLMERGRFAMDRLREDISHAGYWGGYIPTFDDLTWTGQPLDVPTALPDPCLAFIDWQATPGHVPALLGLPLQLHRASPGAGCNTLLGAESVDAATDVLIIRHADICSITTESCADKSSSGLYFQASNCASELASGQLYALDPDRLPLTEMDCSSPAPARRFSQNIYFIRDNSWGVPALYRSAFGYSSGEPRQLTAQEMVPGVERLRVGLGVDNRSRTGALTDYTLAPLWQEQLSGVVPINRGDGVPDGPFVYCSEAQPCTTDDLMNTSAVRLHLLVRAELPTAGYRDTKIYEMGDLSIGPFNDAYKRHVFSSTVGIHNVALRRETQ